jgi:hypothetical protein
MTGALPESCFLKISNIHSAMADDYLKGVDFQGGKVTFNSLDNNYADFKNGVSIEDLWLSEDLLQVEYPHCILDVGWYDNIENGVFKTVVIVDSDWSNPRYRITSVDFERLKPDMKSAIDFVMAMPSAGVNRSRS